MIDTCSRLYLSLVSLFVRLWVEIARIPKRLYVAASASSWGCELKCRPYSHSDKQFDVSLFVRLWVEIDLIFKTLVDDKVSLFVRLWVEIPPSISNVPHGSSASSWGCELKYTFSPEEVFAISQPLREAVSWNTFSDLIHINCGIVSLFVRLWVEMSCPEKYLCETESASSWGCELKFLYAGQNDVPHLSASSWGCELKCLHHYKQWNYCRQPLREAVSWNKSPVSFPRTTPVSLFVRLWVEIPMLRHR